MAEDNKETGQDIQILSRGNGFLYVVSAGVPQGSVLGAVLLSPTHHALLWLASDSVRAAGENIPHKMKCGNGGSNI
ncbi:hypothetical protein J6590_001851 [Homalodisca vitripennis]|nr:hypothetical protein J6590_001851 [Homalodisca vitripennis]